MLRKINKPCTVIIRNISSIILFISLTGCATVEGWFNSEKSTSSDSKALSGTSKKVSSPSTNKNDPANIIAEIDKLKEEQDKNKELLAILNMEVASHKEQIASTRRQLEILRRAARSGLYEDQPTLNPEKPQGSNKIKSSEIHEEKDKKSALLTEKPQLSSPPDLSYSKTNTESVSLNIELENSNIPTTLFADAELKFRRGQFGDSITKLTELTTKYPNANNTNLALLMLAECWINISEFENALPPLQNFYLVNQAKSEILRAKFLEAKAHEGLGAKEKAAALYRELIALDSQAKYSALARNALIRMRDTK